MGWYQRGQDLSPALIAACDVSKELASLTLAAGRAGLLISYSMATRHVRPSVTDQAWHGVVAAQASAHMRVQRSGSRRT